MKFMCKNKLFQSSGMQNELFKVQGRKPNFMQSLGCWIVSFKLLSDKCSIDKRGLLSFHSVVNIKEITLTSISHLYNSLKFFSFFSILFRGISTIVISHLSITNESHLKLWRLLLCALFFLTIIDLFLSSWKVVFFFITCMYLNSFLLSRLQTMALDWVPQ